MPRLIPSPTSIPVPGGKVIDEYVGAVNTQTDGHSPTQPAAAKTRQQIASHRPARRIASAAPAMVEEARPTGT